MWRLGSNKEKSWIDILILSRTASGQWRGCLCPSAVPIRKLAARNNSNHTNTELPYHGVTHLHHTFPHCGPTYKQKSHVSMSHESSITVTTQHNAFTVYAVLTITLVPYLLFFMWHGRCSTERTTLETVRRMISPRKLISDRLCLFHTRCSQNTVGT